MKIAKLLIAFCLYGAVESYAMTIPDDVTNHQNPLPYNQTYKPEPSQILKNFLIDPNDPFYCVREGDPFRDHPEPHRRVPIFGNIKLTDLVNCLGLCAIFCIPFIKMSEWIKGWIKDIADVKIDKKSRKLSKGETNSYFFRKRGK